MNPHLEVEYTPERVKKMQAGLPTRPWKATVTKPSFALES